MPSLPAYFSPWRSHGVAKARLSIFTYTFTCHGNKIPGAQHIFSVLSFFLKNDTPVRCHQPNSLGSEINRDPSLSKQTTRQPHNETDEDLVRNTVPEDVPEDECRAILHSLLLCQYPGLRGQHQPYWGSWSNFLIISYGSGLTYNM